MKSISTLLTRNAAFIVLALISHSMPLAAQAVLNDYARQGLANNVVVQQKAIAYEQAERSLQIASGAFLPSVVLLADYTSGEGGRSISIPVGEECTAVVLADQHAI